MKVYQIVVKPYQDFAFYSRNGILTLCSDPKYPYIAVNSNSTYYDGSTKQWIQINNPMHPLNYCLVSYSDRMVCPSWFVEQQYYVEHIKEQLNDYLKTCVSQFKEEPFNIFVFKKDLRLKGKNLLSISMFSRPNLRGFRHHVEFTQHCQKILKLKTFW